MNLFIPPDVVEAQLNSPPVVDLPAWLAGVLIVAGVVIIIIALKAPWARAQPDGVSQLVPTLAKDALDDDLQQLYSQSRVLDERVDRRYSLLGSETGTELGRRVRKIVVIVQTARYANRQSRLDATSPGDAPPRRDPRLDEVANVLDKAFECVADGDLSGDIEQILAELSARIPLESPAQ